VTFEGFHESEVKGTLQLSYRQYTLYIFSCVGMELKSIFSYLSNQFITVHYQLSVHDLSIYDHKLPMTYEDGGK